MYTMIYKERRHLLSDGPSLGGKILNCLFKHPSVSRMDREKKGRDQLFLINWYLAVHDGAQADKCTREHLTGKFHISMISCPSPTAAMKTSRSHTVTTYAYFLERLFHFLQSICLRSPWISLSTKNYLLKESLFPVDGGSGHHQGHFS